MQIDNIVSISGLLHHVRGGERQEKYFPFSVKQETPQDDGALRKDFLVSRAFAPDIIEQVKALPDGAPLRVNGILQSSLGSGEMYINAREVEPL